MFILCTDLSFSHKNKLKLNNLNKEFQPDRKVFAFPEAGRGKCLTVAFDAFPRVRRKDLEMKKKKSHQLF